MYKKIESLNRIANIGLNVHHFKIPDTYEEYARILQKFKLCTIRTDHRDISEDLPFFVYNALSDQNMDSIWDISQQRELKLIISNGIQYDSIQEYNMVIRIQSNGDFEFEASELKIPLRHMYRHPLLSCFGSLADDASSWVVFNNRPALNRVTIRKDILDLYNKQIFNQWLEITKYPIPVGTQKENIVFWQVI